MKNPYLEKLEKIEFIVSYACSGNCEHCSEGDHERSGECIDTEIAADAVEKIVKEYEIKTLMVFGGEPLLYTGAVEKLMNTATKLNIPKRQLITNGYFSTDEEKIENTAKRLAKCGVNDLLLSVDAFHQKTIPLKTVRLFAKLT